jgi:hypothetical protein
MTILSCILRILKEDAVQIIAQKHKRRKNPDFLRLLFPYAATSFRGSSRDSFHPRWRTKFMMTPAGMLTAQALPGKTAVGRS